MSGGVLDDRCTITLGGRSYEWERPVRRVSRRWMADMAPLADVAQRAERGDFAAIADACDAMLEFFYARHPGMAADKAVLDDATEADIGTAFGAISEFLVRPFVTRPDAPETEQTVGAEPSETNCASTS